jgi:hypothetical protein
VLRVIDFGVKWKQLQAGEVLVREGQPSDGCLYVLLHGRARSSIRSSDGGGGPQDEGEREQHGEGVVVLADHGRGTLIGETEVLTGGRHKATVQAVRYTSFATLPSSVLGLLIRRHPRVLATLAEHVVGKAAYSYSAGRGGGARGGAAASQRRRRWTGEASAGLDVGVGVPPLFSFGSTAGGAGGGVPGAGGVGASGGATTSPAGRAVIGDAGAKTILVLPAYVLWHLCSWADHVRSRTTQHTDPPSSSSKPTQTRSFSVPLDLFCQTLEAAMVKARHSVRTVTSALAASVLGLEDLKEVPSWEQQGMDALLLESWLTQQEEQHEVGAGVGGGCGLRARGWVTTD